MPLEKFFSGEQPINVKDLTIENPEKEEGLPFDPEKEMTEEDWKEVRQTLEARNFPSAVATAAILMQTYPEQAEQFDAGATIKKLREDGEHFFNGADEHRRGDTAFPTSEEAEVLYAMKTLTPELFQKFGTPARMARCKKSSIGSLQVEGVLYHNAFVAPGLLGPNIVDATENPEGIWKVEKNEIDAAKTDERWEEFALVAASTKLLFPERFSELEVDPDAWKNMEKCFQEQIRSRADKTKTFFFPELLISLKILAAEEIKLNEDGSFEITMSKPKPKLETGTPPMPERRKF